MSKGFRSLAIPCLAFSIFVVALYVERAGAGGTSCTASVMPALSLSSQERQEPTASCGCGSTEADRANAEAWAAHRMRCLDKASAAYDRVLTLAPPRRATAKERALAETFAPLLMTTHSEPFALKDVVAVLHPTKPWIAYHLFWDDDIDFPDDNDPSDHEIVWVQLDEKRQRMVRYATYFHGRVLEAPPAAVARSGRPEVAVQWGKHGTMPWFWHDLTIAADSGDVEASYYPLGRPITLDVYNKGIYRKLSTVGRRHQESPLGKSWPKKFTGTWEQFIDFSRLVDPGGLLARKRMIEVTCYANAVINRKFLRYNFRPKLEWPESLSSSKVKDRP